MEGNFDVILTGELSPGQELETVIPRLASMFKSSEKGIQQLLARAPVAIKKQVDSDTANKYRAAVERAGVVCVLEAQQPPGPVEPVSAPEQPAQLPVPEKSETVSTVDDAIGSPAPVEAVQGPAHDIYAPPEAALEADYLDSDELTEPQKVSAARSWSWFLEGFGSFKQNPVSWMLIFVGWMAGSVLLSMIPVVQIVLYIIAPVVAGGLMMGCAAQLSGEDLKFRHLFAGFSEHGKKLAIVGGIYLGSMILLAVVAGFFGVLMAISMGGGFDTLMSGFEGVGTEPGSDQLSGSLLEPGFGPIIMVIILIILMVVFGTFAAAMGLWFTPALIVFHDLEIMEAIRLSFRGCLRNWLAFLVYSIIWILLAIPAALTLGLGFLVLGPVFVASIYFSYRDIYTA